MSRKRVVFVTISAMLGLLMASMESTVVSTAVPTIVSELGGIESYSWVFSAYMLASATAMPIFGKLSDQYGRRSVYIASMVLFAIGSLCCGLAQSMPQLIIFRLIQGIGAGGLLPLAFIIIGDLFTLERRARMQGLFASVWGVSSIIGPLIGGFLVDRVSWHWIFFMNIVPITIALVLVWFTWPQKTTPATSNKPSIDYGGVVVLAASVVVLLLGIMQIGTPTGWLLLVLAAACFALLLRIERRATDPVLPLSLAHNRMFLVACGQGLLGGAVMFGSTAFVPLFMQVVLTSSATTAGATLTPMMVGSVFANIIGSRLLMRVSYRNMALLGMGLMSLGALLLLNVNWQVPQIQLIGAVILIGVGMGFSAPALLLAVQSTVQPHSLGTATSTVQFSRSIGGTLGVGVMGAVLSLQLSQRLASAGLDEATIKISSLIEPLDQGTVAAIDSNVRAILAASIQQAFVISLVAAVLGCAITALAPTWGLRQLVLRHAEREFEGTVAPVALE